MHSRLQNPAGMLLSDVAELAAIVSMLGVAAIACLYAVVSYFSNKPRTALPSELEYRTVSTSGKLPNIETDSPEVEITVVVPCYNEEARLHLLLESAVPYLQRAYKNRWELLIVDDGSKDKTMKSALDWAASHGIDEELRYCKFVSNRGKGGAVTHGMKTARGRLILFADADNASDFTCLSDLTKAVMPDLEAGRPSIAIGSRAHLVNTQAVIKRSKLRNFLMHGFHTLVYWFGISVIKDTQCGFKLFTRDAAIKVFPFMHTEGWIFDVEALLIAIRKDITVQEIAISWHEVTGSKIDLARDSIKMAIDLVSIRFAYWFGIYNDGSNAVLSDHKAR